MTAARGHRIAVGDVIISRRNDPDIQVYGATDLDKTADTVRNGNRWRVYAVDPDNHRIAARRLGDDARAVFSHQYLREHIHHGYAVTVHAAQGVTADTTHAVLGDSANRAAAYVALTRGRDTNNAYLYEKIAGEGDHEHAEVTPGVHIPRRGTSRQAADLLRGIIGRDERARTVMAAAADTDRTQLPEQLRTLLDQHDRTRAACRAEYRTYINAQHATRRVQDLAAELPALRAEIDFVEAAGARSPAAMYATPNEALRSLEQPHRSALTSIAGSAQAIHTLALHAGADKPAVLAAIAGAAHHNQRRILALPATTAAAEYAIANRYADTTASPADGRDNLQTGRWKLPIGSLVVIDDADQLDPKHLRYLTDNATRTNTKLLLLTNPQPGRPPAHSLVDVLTTNLPWAQHLGTPNPNRYQASTALERVEHHLATTTGDSPAHAEAAALLQRRDAVIRHYQYLTADITHSRSSGRDRSRDRDHGLDL